AAGARAPDLAAPRPRDVRGGAVDRLRHPPAPPLRRGPFGQGRARRDAAPHHPILASRPPGRRRAQPRARRAGTRGRATAPGRRASDEPAALVPARADRRRSRPGGPDPHAAPPGARARARNRHRARARDRLGGSSGAARGARARMLGRGARVRVRARLLRRGRRARRLRPRLHPRRPLPHHPGPSVRRSGFMRILVAVKQVPDTATEAARQLLVRGRQARDAGVGAVAARLAERLGWPCGYWVMEEAIDADTKTVRAARQVEGGLGVFDLPLPAVLTAQKGLNEPRYPTLRGIMGAKKKEIRDVKAADLGWAPEPPQLSVVTLEALPPR